MYTNHTVNSVGLFPIIILLIEVVTITVVIYERSVHITFNTIFLVLLTWCGCTFFFSSVSINPCQSSKSVFPIILRIHAQGLPHAVLD